MVTVEQFIECLDNFGVSIVDESGNELSLEFSENFSVISAQPDGDSCVLIIAERR